MTDHDQIVTVNCVCLFIVINNSSTYSGNAKQTPLMTVHVSD